VSERHFLFVECFEAFSCAEKKRNTLHACDSDEGVNDARDQRVLTAAYPRDYVESEKSDASPVQCADDRKNKRDSVYQHKSSLPLKFSGLSLKSSLRKASSLPSGNYFSTIIFAVNFSLGIFLCFM
jgi:hypothetical protein